MTTRATAYKAIPLHDLHEFQKRNMTSLIDEENIVKRMRPVDINIDLVCTCMDYTSFIELCPQYSWIPINPFDHAHKYKVITFDGNNDHSWLLLDQS